LKHSKLKDYYARKRKLYGKDYISRLSTMQIWQTVSQRGGHQKQRRLYAAGGGRQIVKRPSAVNDE